MPNAIIDTGIWLAMFDPRDERHSRIDHKADRMDLLNLLVPWPVAYETLRTRLVRNVLALTRFEEYLKRPRVEFLDDSPYRKRALELAFFESRRKKRPLSMVDCLIRLILDDANVITDCLITFNVGDFHDICRKRRIEII